MDQRQPNILLIMTDQHRGDCLGIAGHPVLQTPFLDALAADGVRFDKAYSACPVCIPARRTLMTGRKPRNHGVTMNYNTLLDCPTLPGELSRAGYQTHLVGKLHLWPFRKLYGFDSADWADSPRPHPVVDDYDRFLLREGITFSRAALAHGMNGNGFPARPFHLDERFHFTNWCADNALRFLERRDPTVPFFLNVSFVQPHQPLTPPQIYYDRYMAMELAEPVVGDWARVFDAPQRGLPVAPWRVALEPAQQTQMQAAYYGCINHIDDQIGRILDVVDRSNTIIVFTSDHGEMLGQHQWVRKRNAFEGSAHVPFIVHLPPHLRPKRGRGVSEPVELMDIMPTLLELAGVAIPESVDGRTLVPLLRGETVSWRTHIHGECAEVPTLNSGMHYLTDGRRKYIWYPGRAEEHYFDLEADPDEMTNCVADAGYADEIERWRALLVEELADRPEGFTDGQRLLKLDGTTPFCLPGYERREQECG